jgi:hypothetical protein
MFSKATLIDIGSIIARQLLKIKAIKNKPIAHCFITNITPWTVRELQKFLNMTILIKTVFQYDNESKHHHQLKRFFINFTKLLKISDITIQLIAKLNVSIHDAELDIIYGVNLEDLEYNDSSYKDIKKKFYTTYLYN